MTSYSKGYETFKEGVIACIPTILGYLGIGIAAGVVGKSSGLSIWIVVLMSIIVYGGSSQFIITGMLVTGTPISAIIFTTFLVNLRHFLMSFSVSEYFNLLSIPKSIGIGTLLTDESYGVLMTAVSNKKAVSFEWTTGLNITAYLTWIFSTWLGAVLGNLIPDPDLIGLDYALVAMFIGLIILQIEYPIKNKTGQTLLILGTVVFSLYLLSHLISKEMSVLIATLIGCGVGVVTDGKR
ncbi:MULTISPECIES: AzlC family ABC transporter permease [Vagococcus]|uniref:Branched-chain amino acid transport protein AzlC n=1 Tax=Vagococcus fluvialis bH819 TaxID=1255619 RepID=A0A1X6WR85_9ENTE|nr:MULTISPECIES: AzlC family ABC transporter permease [Vagococcus]SLM86853.1 Branched-chain amino acid transport protein AzlC [Vagococcus fluvialis bH819]HCM88691.1 branched-chain amino acid ABC transporter permease [Vagococcus sp.]